VANGVLIFKIMNVNKLWNIVMDR